MKLGNYEIDVIETGRFGLDGGAMFGVVPKAIWAKSYEPGDDMNRIPLTARIMLIRSDDRNILVDTGNGTKGNEKFQKIYKINSEETRLDNALKPFGLEYGDITDVILTHLHFDHAGGATRMENGNIIPTFPNAKYYVQKDHLEWAKNPTEKDRASFVEDDFMPLEADGMLELLDGAGEIFPGIELIPVHGHTKAMQMLKIKGGEETLLYIADLSPTSAHIRLPFGLAYDNEPLITLEEKKKYLPQAYEEKWTVVFEHDAFTQASKIELTGKGFSAGEKIIITENK